MTRTSIARLSCRTCVALLLTGLVASCGDDSASVDGGSLDARVGDDARVAGDAPFPEDGRVEDARAGDAQVADGESPVLLLDLARLRAFPSAFGKSEEAITGGREGKAFFVTSLSTESDSRVYDAATDSYSGSFAAAMRLDECLTIYFRVAGVIDYTGINNALYYGEGCKTVVGASAPSPGIVIFGTQFADRGDLQGNVIIRGVTILVGHSARENEETAFTYRDGHTILSDSTIGWAGDEAIGLWSGNNIVQRNLVVEGIPEHDTGGIIGTLTFIGERESSTSEHNNVFYSNHRFLNASGDETDVIDIVNNVAYYDGSRLNSHNCDLRLNDVNNFWIDRTNLRNIAHAHKWNSWTADNPNCNDSPSIFASGNVFEQRNGGMIFDGPSGDDERTMYRNHITANGYTMDDPLPSEWFVSSNHPYGGSLGNIIRTARAARSDLVDERNVGARYVTDALGNPTRYLIPQTDAYLNDIANSTVDAYLGDQTRFTIATLGLPAPSDPYADSDRDGMPDTFEDRHGLDKNDPTDALRVTSSWDFGAYVVNNDAGYSNREICHEWMHGGFEILLDYQREGFDIN